VAGSFSLTITPSRRFCAPPPSDLNAAILPETVRLTLRQTGTAVNTHEGFRDFGNNVRVDLEGTVVGSSLTVATLSVEYHNKFNSWSFVFGKGTGVIDGQMVTGAIGGRFQLYGADGNLEGFGRVLFDCTASDHTFQLSPEPAQ
jgi:hypothetical protein